MSPKRRKSRNEPTGDGAEFKTVRGIAGTIACIAIVMLYRCTWGIYYEQKVCNSEKARAIGGVVTAILPDPDNPNAKLIALSGGDTLRNMYAYGLWIRREIGDTILKPANSSLYQVHTRYGVDTYGQHSDCDHIRPGF